MGRGPDRTSGNHLTRRVVLAGIVFAVIAGAGMYIYSSSERIIHKKYDTPLVAIGVPTDSISIAEGERLAHISGCFGCHGSLLEGQVWVDDLSRGRLVAPNLPQVAREYSPAELARVIRGGVRPNGEGVISMPSPMFYHLTDIAVSRLIAFLRTAPVADGLRYDFRAGWGFRLAMVRGIRILQPEIIAEMGPRMAEPAPGDAVALGAYIAQTACTECHGEQLEGDWGPNLVVIEAYTPDEFARFLATGVATGGRELPVMSGVARGRFSYFREAEVVALDAFLRARAARLASSPD